MKRSFVAFFLVLAGCGSGPGGATTAGDAAMSQDSSAGAPAPNGGRP